LNFERFLLFLQLKTIFANRKVLLNLNDKEYMVQQKINWLQVRMN